MIIKQSPEDFFVEEIPCRDWSDDGPFVIFKLTKQGLNTEQVMEILNRRFHIPHSTIKYSGTKDKHAHTIQYISIPNKPGIKNLHLNENNLKLEYVGFADEPLSLGTLKGNRFIITARELDNKELHALKSKKDANVIIPNYFDEQRFSSNNYNIGVNILKKDYKSAVNHMCESSSIYRDTVTIYLAAHPNDYIGALQHIPKKTLMMFIHAVQSFLFNETLSEILIENALKNNIEYYLVPYNSSNNNTSNFVFYKKHSDYEGLIDSLELVGFNTNNMNHHIKHILGEIGLVQRDFIVRAIPELSVEGTTRECFIDVQNFEKRIMEDRVILEFELGKGSYATIVVKMLVNE